MTAIPTRHDEAWRWADLAYARSFIDTAAPANDRLPDTSNLFLSIPSEQRFFLGGRAVDHVAGKPQPDLSAPAHELADIALQGAIDGTVVDLPAGTDGGTLQILHVGTSASSHGITRIRLGAGARLTLIEGFADEGHEHWLNHRLDAELGAGASLTRVVRLLNDKGLVTERAFVRLSDDAQFTQVSIAMGMGVVRTEAQVENAGARAFAQVNGILLGDGEARLDALTRLDHRVPDTQSRQVWRLVAAGESQVSVSGGVCVARDAQRTDAEQSLKALVLKRTASANLKPELEIFADDVKCAHGCTVGELDKAGLFYLESRGIPHEEAEALLTRAFVADALITITDEALREVLDVETQGWLADRGQAAQ